MLPAALFDPTTDRALAAPFVTRGSATVTVSPAASATSGLNPTVTSVDVVVAVVPNVTDVSQKSGRMCSPSPR